ncbi:flagellin [Sulfobacillus harzensis]|uniref:Flagellin n=1 Tax=Sulfobacillus harzensis TaxID=2729629 RepID=A0A7Y0L2S7_9FIRM|nr:flagellin [Sulfobacillus harzensis]
MYINTNVAALFAQNSLSNTQNTLSNLQQEMSTGLQINSPSDNPSGLAIANLMQGEIGGINSAINNATAATNLLNVANGGMQTDVQIVQEIQQLAVQASNSTNNNQDTQDIQSQINDLLNSLDNVAQTLNYNGQAVLNQGAQTNATGNSTVTGFQVGADSGQVAAATYSVSVLYTTTASGAPEDIVTVAASTATAWTTVASGTVSGVSGSSTAGTTTLQLVSGENSTGASSFVIQVNQGSIVLGASTTAYSTAVTVGTAATQYDFQTGPYQGAGDNTQVQLGTFTSATLGLTNIDVTSSSGAQYAISQAKRALSMLTNAQGQVGAQVDQLNYTISNLQTESTNLQSSQSTIMDANMASVTSQFAQQQILMQTGIQALQTAQQLPQLVLKLLS